MLPVLIVDRAHMADRGWPKRADLLGPTSLPFDQEIDNTALAHVALHPRCPRITVRAVDSQADTQGVHDAAERLQRLKQVWSLGHPALRSGLVSMSSQSRPRRLVVSGHRCSLAPDRTRTR